MGTGSGMGADVLKQRDYKDNAVAGYEKSCGKTPARQRTTSNVGFNPAVRCATYQSGGGPIFQKTVKSLHKDKDPRKYEAVRPRRSSSPVRRITRSGSLPSNLKGGWGAAARGFHNDKEERQRRVGEVQARRFSMWEKGRGIWNTVNTNPTRKWRDFVPWLDRRAPAWRSSPQKNYDRCSKFRRVKGKG